MTRIEIRKISSLQQWINQRVELSVKVSNGPEVEPLMFTDLHPYFTPVIGSFSSNRGMALDAFLAKSRSTFSGVGTVRLSSVSAIVPGCAMVE